MQPKKVRVEPLITGLARRADTRRKGGSLTRPAFFTIGRSGLVVAAAVVAIASVAPAPATRWIAAVREEWRAAGAAEAPQGQGAEAIESGTAAPPSGVVPARYIVTLVSGSARDEVVGETRGMGGKVERQFSRVLQGFAASLPPAAVARLERNPKVARVEPDRIVVTTRATQTEAPWGLDRVDQRSLPLSMTYSYERDGTGVRVYVLDTGIRKAHQDFGGRVPDGFDAVAQSSTEDCHGHGTHVAGTVGGRLHGVAKGASLVPVRVLDCNGSGRMSWVIAGLDWVVANRPVAAPAVVNLSLGSPASQALDDAVRRTVSAGIVVVAAAGNSNVDACTSSPARVAEVLTVGATDAADARASFSNFGPCLDIFAPGVRIASAVHTSDTATALLSGTSMAAPHVAGAAALVLGASPTATSAGVAEALLAESTPNVIALQEGGSPNRLLFSPDTTPPSPVTGLVAAGGVGDVALAWSNPPQTDLHRIVVRAAPGEVPPPTSNSGSAVADGLLTSVTVKDLKPGADHSFSVFSLDDSGNTSAPSSITVRGTAVTASASLREVTHPNRVTITGRLTQPSAGLPLGGRRVDLLVRRVGSSSWAVAASATSAQDGTVTATHAPAWNAEYALRFAGAGQLVGVIGSPVRVDVRQSVSATLSTTRVALGSSATLTGAVGPAHPTQRVTLQQRVNGVWTDITGATLSSASTYRFTIRPSSRGTFEYRVVRPADADHALGVSPIRTLEAR